MNEGLKSKVPSTEIELKARNGMPFLLLNILGIILSIALFIFGIVYLEKESFVLGGMMLGLAIFYWCLPMILLFAGLKVIRPNESMVMTLFGRYIGTLKGEGFYFVNPFTTAIPVPVNLSNQDGVNILEQETAAAKGAAAQRAVTKKLSLKTMALSNNKQKVNDQQGNPIIISIVVIWRVADTAKAMFDVDNFVEYLSIQCDSALRNIVRLYPYDAADNEDANEKSLRGSSQEISTKLSEEIQSKVEVAGLEILEARITHLAYAPEIAAAMLQRQQASAIVDARQLIVEGAVGMVEMALKELNAQGIVDLDEERKAAMVSNLLVVLCGNRDAQPVVNSGSLY
ncbi:SPFH domain-containing protein [Enterococcus sp. BWB1-3]|uniref:SPFH domain-containing protein n=1 Tax=unclassified Enterococcus TaxID=2608891 RepID=UPI001921C573|nr:MULTISPECIES: SPFH domain-containing protein [unclassified Enterococcus]MBL1230595.1 SPFH domain-containing protein [Enterococcus sp. BWB1-3]MCB5950900.1 SPFH domain-containing protein [Enterococcus sp. BWT-B8]